MLQSTVHYLFLLETLECETLLSPSLIIEGSRSRERLSPHQKQSSRFGEMAEWLKAAVC